MSLRPVVTVAAVLPEADTEHGQKNEPFKSIEELRILNETL